MRRTENANVNRSASIQCFQFFRSGVPRSHHRRRSFAVDFAIDYLIAKRQAHITLGLTDDARGTNYTADLHDYGAGGAGPPLAGKEAVRAVVSVAIFAEIAEMFAAAAEIAPVSFEARAAVKAVISA